MSANTDIFTKSWCSKTNQEDHPEVWKRQIQKEKKNSITDLHGRFHKLVEFH